MRVELHNTLPLKEINQKWLLKPFPGITSKNTIFTIASIKIKLLKHPKVYYQEK